MFCLQLSLSIIAICRHRTAAVPSPHSDFLHTSRRRAAFCLVDSVHYRQRTNMAMVKSYALAYLVAVQWRHRVQERLSYHYLKLIGSFHSVLSMTFSFISLATQYLFFSRQMLSDLRIHVTPYAHNYVTFSSSSSVFFNLVFCFQIERQIELRIYYYCP